MLFSLFLAALTAASAQDIAVATSSVMPTYLALAPSLHDFSRFADGGPDGNWFVGFNNAWIVKLPAAPQGEFAKAYIGARLGRAKTRPNPNKPWVRELIDGKIYMGVSQTPAFSSEQSFFLAETSDLGVEGDPQSFVEGIGPADWFWTEVPLTLVSNSRPNYLIIWSPSKYLVGASSAPIIAGAADEEGASHETRAWNNHSILGVPPRTPVGALETPLNNMSPALAIKLVPAAESEVSVGDFSLQRLAKRSILQFSVACTDLAEAWIEISRDQLDWTRATRYQRKQPFLFSIGNAQLQPGSFVRAAARDSLGKVGHSEALAVPYAAR
jgi:hypothetical protein